MSKLNEIMKSLMFIALFSLSSFVTNTNPESIQIQDQNEIWLYSFVHGTAHITHLGSDYEIVKPIVSGKNKVEITQLPEGTSSIVLRTNRGKIMETIYIDK